MWPLPTQQQLDETLRRQSLIVNSLITDNKYLISVVTASFTAPSLGQQTGDRTLPSLEHCSMQQTSLPATTANRCRQNLFDKGEKTKSRWSSFAERHGQSSPTLQLEQNGFSPVSQTEPSTIGPGLPRSTEVTVTMTQTQGQTLPYLMPMTTTSPLTSQPSTSLQHSSPQFCPLAPQGLLASSLMFQGEDHGVSSGVIADSLALEPASCWQCASGVVSLSHLTSITVLTAVWAQAFGLESKTTLSLWCIFEHSHPRHFRCLCIRVRDISCLFVGEAIAVSLHRLFCKRF